MALKVKAKEQYQNIGKYAGTYRYVMMPELYTALAQDKVIKEAALRSGVSRGVMQACWDAAGEVIKTWATEGHAVALPGLGSMRFGLRSKSVEKVEDVEDPEVENQGGENQNGGGNQNENSDSDFPPEVDPSTDQPAND